MLALVILPKKQLYQRFHRTDDVLYRIAAVPRMNPTVQLLVDSPVKFHKCTINHHDSTKDLANKLIEESLMKVISDSVVDESLLDLGFSLRLVSKHHIIIPFSLHPC